jgi:hypothetical protein
MGKMSNPILLIIACLTVAEACFRLKRFRHKGCGRIRKTV